MLISSVVQEVGHKFPSMLLQSIDITNCVENEHAHLKQDNNNNNFINVSKTVVAEGKSPLY